MELQFDKEIDAILRKARGGLAAPGPAAGGGHVDADAIAAFAENALPAGTRTAYISHFADCDGCRQRLSRAMSDVDVVPSGSTPVITTAAAAMPWYSKLFRTPGLAFGMGALVLVFSGVLAFLVLQDRNAGNAIITHQTTNESPGDGIFSSGAAANTSAPADVAAAVSESNANGAAPRPESSPVAKQETDTRDTKSTVAKESSPREENGYVADGVAGTDAAKPEAAAPPPPPVMSEVTVTEVEKKDEDRGAGQPSDDATLSKRKSMDRRRDAPPAASKSGPSRAGPMQNQTNQMNSNLGEMSVTRSVGGKKFNNRDGVWYDTSYRGQATTNYRRSSTDYKSLDGGLRGIANELGGTVVVVWKGKAYRIS